MWRIQVMYETNFQKIKFGSSYLEAHISVRQTALMVVPLVPGRL